MAYVTVIENDDIWLLQEHELIEYLQDRVEDENLTLEDYNVGEKLPEVTLRLSQKTPISLLKRELKRRTETKQEYKFKCSQCSALIDNDPIEYGDGDLICQDCYEDMQRD